MENNYLREGYDYEDYDANVVLVESEKVIGTFSGMEGCPKACSSENRCCKQGKGCCRQKLGDSEFSGCCKNRTLQFKK